MIDLEITAEIPAHADAVWAVLSDYRHDADWRRGVVEMQPDPPGPSVPGTTTHEVMRLGGRTYVNDGVVDVVVPGERLDWHTTQGAEASGSRQVTPLADGRCRVTLRLRVRPRGGRGAPRGARACHPALAAAQGPAVPRSARRLGCVRRPRGGCVSEPSARLRRSSTRTSASS
jgi:hypothetical protein